MTRHRFAGVLLFVASISPIISTTKASAEVKLPPVIGNHMVLQREMSLPIWGTAAAGEKVTVRFRDQQKSATADAAGKWRVKLDPLKAGGPDTLIIAGANAIRLEAVLVGEVWVGSGQSNMDCPVTEFWRGDTVLAEAAKRTHPRLRLIVTAAKTAWKEATPESIQGFSALLFAFGVALQKELDVPVGLVEGAVGATASRCWLSKEAYESDPGVKAALERYTTVEYPRLMEKWRVARAEADAKAEKEGKPRPRHPLRPPGYEDA